MHKILTLNNISPVGLERLPRQNYEIASEIQNPDAILLRSFKMHDMEIPATLKAVGRAGAGVNNIPIDRMSKAGIVVFNAPGANANAVKELVIAGMLLACRSICQGWHYTVNAAEQTDDELAKAVEAGKKKYAGFELPGRTLGVVGLGAIGVKVANAARALGMRVVGFDPQITVQSAWRLSADIEQAVSIDDLCSRADFITFHVPFTEGTKNLLNAERLALMPNNAVILNFARNGIVDDDAVLKGIESGKIYAYVTDFPTNRLRKAERVITLPHLGASTAEAEDNCAVMVADQVRDYLENGNVLNSVNFPTVHLPRAGAQRLAVVNENRPDMVSQISHVLGGGNVNILHMVNESKGELAYTLLDVDSKLDAKVVEQVKAIKGVLAVRVL
ncbi:MAG: phosphoglycerate dehydrogenase [Gammaproteobacteria bacterium]|nr:phosphoglycerate dehydrogenase [Gammaproteobacteria bacterium]